MTVQSWAALIVSICTIVAFATGSVKWLVKHYFDEIKSELKPNGGSSIKDQINRLEQKSKDAEEDRKHLHDKLDRLYETMLDFMANNKK
jgi:flagellar motor component MotA